MGGGIVDVKIAMEVKYVFIVSINQPVETVALNVANVAILLLIKTVINGIQQPKDIFIISSILK